MTLKTSNHHRILLGLSLKGLIAVVLFSIVLVLTIFSLIFNWRGSSVAFTPVKTDSDAPDSCDSEVNTNSKAIFAIENNTVCTPFSKSLKAIVVPAFASSQSSPTYIQPVFERNFGEVKRIPGNKNISEFEKISCKGVCESTPPATTPPATTPPASTSCKGVCQSTPPATTPPATIPPATTPPASTSCKGCTVATTPPTTIPYVPPTTARVPTTTQSQSDAIAEAAQRAIDECIANGGIPRSINYGISCDYSNNPQRNCELHGTRVWKNGRCVSPAEGACIDSGSGWRWTGTECQLIAQQNCESRGRVYTFGLCITQADIDCRSMGAGYRWTGSQCLGPSTNQSTTTTAAPPVTPAQQCRSSHGSWNGSRCISPAELECRGAAQFGSDVTWDGSQCINNDPQRNCELHGTYMWRNGRCVSPAEGACIDSGSGYRWTGSQCLGPPVNQGTTTPITLTQSQSDAIAEAAQRATEECLASGGIPETFNHGIVCDFYRSYAAPTEPENNTVFRNTQVKCWRYTTSFDVNEALNFAPESPELATCIPPGMLAIRDYSVPSWGYDENVYDTYGWLLVREGGECSYLFDTIAFYDFQIACKAHDYCYDIIEAGLSYPLSKSECDAKFYSLMGKNCNKRSWIPRQACKTAAFVVNKAVKSAGNPSQNPGRIVPSLQGEDSNELQCLELAEPSMTPSAVEIIEIDTCVSGMREFRFKAVATSNGDLSKYGLFQIERVLPGVCGKKLRSIVTDGLGQARIYSILACDKTEEALSNLKCLEQSFNQLGASRIILADCNIGNAYQHFRIVATSSMPSENLYYIQNANSTRCLGVVGYVKGNDATMNNCSSLGDRKVWEIKKGLEIEKLEVVEVPLIGLS